ncbi:MAG: universal stress protein UspA [Caulobacteraceae bacterium]|nr:universal stress protein UspA [Caulobacteraceae bacterium]
MSWARILVPLAGEGESEAALVEAAIKIAAPFQAEVALAHVPVDIAAIAPWMAESFMGGLQSSAMLSLEEASVEGLRAVQALAEASTYRPLSLTALNSPVWAQLAMESRLSDLVVFGPQSARGRGALAEPFQLLVGDEQRPVLVVHEGLDPTGTIAVAWHGGKESSRAVRTALPLLKLAARVVVLAAPKASSRSFDPGRLQAFLEARGVAAEISLAEGHGDAAHLLLDAARDQGAKLMVAGCFGHPRLQEFIFGGATRTLLNSEGLSLFLSH